MLLAGDIGGTKTVLALYPSVPEPRAPVSKAAFSSRDYPDLEALVREFIADVRVERACFGVAGPVVGGHAAITNLPWTMDAARLQESLGFSVHLINDLVAIASGVMLLEPKDLSSLNDVEGEPGGSIGVIAPGTGLGEAFLTWDGERYRPYPSEGGHADFAPRTPLQAGFLAYLQRLFGHASYERVCSGIGIPAIYAYLKESGHAPEPDWLAERLAGAADPTPVIASAALDDPPSPLCAATMEMFVSVLGAEAGNLALKILATGGIYVGGGIPPRILPLLHRGGFMRAFLDKGRFSNLMARIPVRVILTPEVALRGAAWWVMQERMEET